VFGSADGRLNFQTVYVVTSLAVNVNVQLATCSVILSATHYYEQCGSVNKSSWCRSVNVTVLSSFVVQVRDQLRSEQLIRQLQQREGVTLLFFACSGVTDMNKWRTAAFRGLRRGTFQHRANKMFMGTYTHKENL